MTIYDVLSKSGTKTFQKKYTGEIGLEIETEVKSENSYPEGFLIINDRGNLTAPGLRYWDIHRDGSLRNFGIEYVLKQPLKYEKELPEALSEFGEKTAKIKFIKDAVTTSVHVHLNMLNENFKTLGNFLTLYSLFENILIRYSGPDRLSNLFCLPICDAEDTYRNIVNIHKCIDQKKYSGLVYSESAVKYAALNLGAFMNYGSLEIRSFRGETDVKTIQKWVDILYSMLSYSRGKISPKEIMLSWKEKQTKFLDEVFKDNRKELSHPDEMRLIDKNVWYAASAAYAVKDWDRVDEMVKPPEFKPKQKELDSYSVSTFGRPFGNLDISEQEHVLTTLRRHHNQKYFIKGDFRTADRWAQEAQTIAARTDPQPAIRPLQVRRTNIDDALVQADLNARAADLANILNPTAGRAAGPLTGRAAPNALPDANAIPPDWIEREDFTDIVDPED